LQPFENVIGIVTAPLLVEDTVELLNGHVNPVDAINALSQQMTWALSTEVASLWAISDALVGVPNTSSPGGIDRGFVRYLLEGGVFPEDGRHHER
jgi:hypothetical protein